MRVRAGACLGSLVVAALCACSSLLSAQGRVAAGKAFASRATIANTVPVRARLGVDLGGAPADQVLRSVRLRFSMSAARSQALDQLLVAQQNPASPEYHRWLTPEQFGVRFGLSAPDLAEVTAWLESTGLKVTGTARARTFLTVSGTVAQVESAFGTTIHRLSLNGAQHFSNVTDPSLPTRFAALVTTITGLNDLRLRPHAHPHYTSSVPGEHFIAPGDFYTIYDELPLLSEALDGSGITIAVAGQTDISLADVAAFRSASGLNGNLPVTYLYGNDPGTSSDDLDEAQLDVEWSGAVAPEARILYVNSTDVLNDSLTQIVDQDLAPIASISYGDCESNFGAPTLAVFGELFREANAQGQTIVGPGGDDGATDCDFGETIAIEGLAVDFPGSSPNVTSVGGSMFNEGSGVYWSAANGANGGSALTYIPETVWNETALGGGLAAGGGGASAYFSKPPWQSGTGVPADSARDVPDVVFNAASYHDGYLFCSRGFCTDGFEDSGNYVDVVGGTSVSTPALAGVLALLEQKTGSLIGNANPAIYGLANSSYASAVFHDIVSGNNDSPCAAGTPDCASGGEIGYSATAGYDLASGWGSIDTFNLVNDWLNVTGGGNTIVPSASATSLQANASSVRAGASVALTATVASATAGVTMAMPTGTVQLLVDGTASGQAVAVANGTVAFAYATGNLSAGAHVFTGVYSGDSNFLTSAGSATVNILAAVVSDFTVTSSAAATSAKAGGRAMPITFTVTPANGFTGAVQFVCASSSSSLAAAYSFSVDPVVVSGSAGNTVLTLIASSAPGQGVTALLRRDHSVGARLPAPVPWQVAAGGFACAGLLLVMPRRRGAAGLQGLRALLLPALVLAGATLVNGCGQNDFSTLNTSSYTAGGTYLVTVTATGINSLGEPLSHTSTVTFTVN